MSLYSYCNLVVCVCVFAGSVLDTGLHEQQPSKNADLLTFTDTLDTIMRSHYPSVHGSVAVRLVPCPNICSEALSLLGRLVPVHGGLGWLEKFVLKFVGTARWWGAGMVFSLERGADLHMAQLMLLPLTVSCFGKIQIGFTFSGIGSPT